MRAIVILILIVVAIGLLRMLVGDVIKAVKKSTSSQKDAPAEPPPGADGRAAGRLVKDPETGAYVDESTAIKVEFQGQTYFFESEASRDAFLQRNRS